MPKSYTKATGVSTDAQTAPWTRWQNQVVRDLAWCCLGQDLIGQLPGTAAQPYRLPASPGLYDWLDDLDNEPSTLLVHLSALKSTRLGVYFEALWHFFWQWHSDIEVLAYNKQVMHNNQTLGAFDFLLRQRGDLRNPFVHVECAVKFYLGTGGEDWQHWIGPGANDRLDIKLRRLLQHQLPLAQHPAVSRLEVAPGIRAAEFAQAYLLRGYFFSHIDGDRVRPEYSNPRLPDSRWCYCRELSGFVDTRVFAYQLLSRQQWLCPISKPTGQASVTAEDIICAVKTNQRAVFVSVFARTEAQVTELQRLCVVPDHWPITATPPRSM
ncbi:MAG TPA: DUF1853 family protein [Cellvibrionaceae bacterium]